MANKKRSAKKFGAPEQRGAKQEGGLKPIRQNPLFNIYINLTTNLLIMFQKSKKKVTKKSGQFDRS